VNHLGGFGVFEFGTGNGVDRFFQKIRRAVHGIHILVDHPPHVTALATEDPFNPQALGFHIHLGVEPFHGLMGGKKTKITALGCVGAPSDLQSVFDLQVVEQHHIPHAGIGARVREHIP